MAPSWLREHREYFAQGNRGFGESPFHSAWKLAIEKGRPRSALEIGVYRGQTISLWQLIAEKTGQEIDVWGVSPMSDAGDTQSRYPDIDYEVDIRRNFAQFGLKTPNLLRALSTDSSAHNLICSKLWDLIYIDGDHDFETVLHDYKLAFGQLKKGGILCLDDSSALLKIPISGLFKGHPGPSKVVVGHALQEMAYIMTVGHLNFFRKK